MVGKQRPEHHDRISGRPAEPRSGAGERPLSVAGSAVTALAMIGYSSFAGSGRVGASELKQQAELIARECGRRGLRLLELIGEREPANGKGLGRPGLEYALERICTGQAGGLVVTDLCRVTRSASDLGALIRRLDDCGARLIVQSQAIDTADPNDRRFADVLIEISGWERERISRGTRRGLAAARRRGGAKGRGAVTDDPALSELITRMRESGMTLQAIADELNERGVPTVRGGTKWRHSSIRATIANRRCAGGSMLSDEKRTA